MNKIMCHVNYSHLTLNRKDEKKYVEIQKFDLLGNKTVKTIFFLVRMFSSPNDYLASRTF